jgi:hypothetical protein
MGVAPMRSVRCFGRCVKGRGGAGGRLFCTARPFTPCARPAPAHGRFPGGVVGPVVGGPSAVISGVLSAGPPASVSFGGFGLGGPGDTSMSAMSLGGYDDHDTGSVESGETRYRASSPLSKSDKRWKVCARVWVRARAGRTVGGGGSGGCLQSFVKRLAVRACVLHCTSTHVCVCVCALSPCPPACRSLMCVGSLPLERSVRVCGVG